MWTGSGNIAAEEKTSTSLTHSAYSILGAYLLGKRGIWDDFRTCCKNWIELVDVWLQSTTKPTRRSLKAFATRSARSSHRERTRLERPHLPAALLIRLRPEIVIPLMVDTRNWAVSNPKKHQKTYCIWQCLAQNPEYHTNLIIFPKQQPDGFL